MNISQVQRDRYKIQRDIITYMVIPKFAIVVYNSGTKAPSWTNPSIRDGYGSQVNQENGKANGQCRTHLSLQTIIIATWHQRVKL